MSYQVKRTIVSITTGILILASYCLWTVGKVRLGGAAPDDLKFWAGAMLVFIAIGIGASIIIQILFHVLLSVGIAVKKQVQNGKCDDKEVEKEIKLEMVEDEMDKLIALKSMRIAFAIAGIGFVAALVSLVLGYSPAVMLNILFVLFSLGSIIEGIAQLFFYKRGVQNGR